MPQSSSETLDNFSHCLTNGRVEEKNVTEEPRKVAGRLRMKCPFCGGRLIIRTSYRVSPITAHALGECKECTYRGHLSIEHTSIAFPSDSPKALKSAVYLPVSDYMQGFVNKKQMERMKADMFEAETHESKDDLKRLNVFQAHYAKLNREELLKLIKAAEDLKIIPCLKS